MAATRKLNDTLALGARIAPAERFDEALGRPLYPGYQISPDNGTLVFLADQSTAGVMELYSVPMAGGAPRKLNGPLALGGNVREFAIDSGGDRVVYLADQRADESYELFSAPLAGGPPVALSSFLVQGGDVTNFVLSPDGGTAVFRADRNDDEVFDLFSAPVAGGLPDVQLNRRDSLLGDVQPDFAITGDNQRVIFRYDPLQEGVFDLFSAPLTGGSPADKLTSAPVGDPGGPAVLDFLISPRGNSVASRVSNPATGRISLFLSPSAGPIGFFVDLTAVFLTGSVEAPPASDVLPEDRLSAEELPYAFAPDGADVFFIADPTDGLYQLHQVSASATPNSPLLLTTLLGAASDVTNFRISPDGARLIYRADDVDNRFELFTVQRGGGGETFLLPASPSPTSDIFEFAISPDGGRVIYRGDLDDDERFELRSSPIDRSAGTVVISGPLAPGGDVLRFAITANGQRAIYSADQDVDGVVELYSVLLGGGAPTRLNAGLANGGDVLDFVTSPTVSGGRVVFRADGRTDEVYTLQSAPAAGGPSVTLSGAGSVSGDVAAFALTPDGSRAVYIADQRTDEVFELFSRSLDSAGELRRLSGELGPDGDVAAITLGPDGKRVVYLADQSADEVFELYSASFDNGDAVKLNPPLPAGATIREPQVSPDGRRVVYLADIEAQGVFDLYSVPITGGPTVRLSSLAAGRSMLSYAISPDAERLVFLANQSRAEAFELFSVDLAGGTPTTLNGPLPAGGNILEFQISPDSSRVAFLGDQHSDETFELYSVPLAGGAAARLNPPLLADRDVGGACVGHGSQWQPQRPGASFLVSPNSSRVLYCADQDADEVGELYSAPLAGDGPAVKINFPPGAGGGVRRFALSDSSSHVVFDVLAIVAGSPQGQLYSAPIAGGALPTLLNGPVRAFSFVEQFGISPDGGAVVFISDRGGGANELYAVSIEGGAVSRRSGGLGPGGNVEAFKLSADGGRVVYLSDQGGDGVSELFVADLAGAAEPRALSGPLAAGGDVQNDFALTSAGSVVYRADQEIDEVFELFQATVDEPKLRLHLPLLTR
jgi:Tol biopolymer transport system component